MGGNGSGRVGTKCQHGVTKSYCKTCEANRKRARYIPTGTRNKTNIKQMVRQYKISLKHCVICQIKINDSNFMMFALDHRDPAQKLFNLSQARSQPSALVLAECLKCELMCHNCHHLKTHQSGDHKVRRDEITVQDEYLPLLGLMYASD